MRSKKGFTLIELMVVIAIIAVLAAVVTPQIFKQIAKGKGSAALSFADSVKVASTSYYADRGSWPASCTQVTCNTAANSFVVGGAANWDGPYLNSWPGTGRNPWGGNYSWNYNALATNFNATPPVVAAPERWLSITVVPATAANYLEAFNALDRAKDGADGNAAGSVRQVGPVTPILLLIERDGPVN